MIRKIKNILSLIFKYNIIGECQSTCTGKWRIPNICHHWVSVKSLRKYYGDANIDPNGNAIGSNDGNRLCLFLDIGPVELREGDRVVVFRKKT